MSNIRRTAADEPFFLIRALAVQMMAAQVTGRHVHDWGQLIYCSAGVMTVWTEEGSWVAPPHWAVWVPAGVAHDIRFVGDCALRTLYLRPDVAAELPVNCAVMTVSPLLRELVLRAVDLRMLDERDRADQAVALLISHELARRSAAPFDLPAPASQLARQAAELLAGHDPHRTITAVARRIGLSPRALERRFVAETGMAIASWGRQARLLQALRQLAAGEAVKSVAQAAGYRTPSAFVAAFRTAFGQTPGQYFASPGATRHLGEHPSRGPKAMSGATHR
jgi:AraC-like DNA-binding protein